MKLLYSYLDSSNNVVDVVEIDGIKYTMNNLGKLRYF